MAVTSIAPPVASKLIDNVTLNLDGRDWQLVVSFNVLCDFEKLTGINVILRLNELRSASSLRALLYLCLREQGAKYTLEETGRFLNHRTLLYINKALDIGIENSLPQNEDVAEFRAQFEEPEPGEITAAAAG